MGKKGKKQCVPKIAIIMTVGFVICLLFAIVYYLAYFNFEAAASEGTGDLWGSFGLILAFAAAGSTYLAYAIYLTLGTAIFGILAIIFWKRRI